MMDEDTIIPAEGEEVVEAPEAPADEAPTVETGDEEAA